MYKIFLSLCLILLFIIFNFSCLKVIPERGQITYLNDKYFSEGILTIRKYKRRGEYVINLGANAKYILDNNVSVDIVFYEYLHNEYKPSFIEFHYRICDMIQKDLYIGEIVRSYGYKTCPMKAGKIMFQNITFDRELPGLWPFEKGKLEGKITQITPSVEKMAVFEIMMSFKQDLNLPKLKT